LTALLGGGQGGQTNQPGVRPSGGINTGGVPALLGGVVSEQARQRQQQTLNEAQQTLGLQRTAVDQVATNAQQVADANQARYDTQGGIFRDADSLRRSMYDPEAAAEDARRGYLNAANKRRRQMARGAAGGGRGYAEMEARRYDVESPLGAETAARNAYLGAGTAGLKNAATTYGMVPGLTPTNFGGVASAYSGLGANQLGIMNAQGQLGLQQAANYGGIASGALDIGRGLATWFGNQGSEPLRRFNEESRP
jgi:hypothetical protein